ncbi:MAG: bifunctional ornithine acetyltransferase/N-acetylglutamate synthase [Candidatus Methanospirareceae archaeon]
MDIRVVKGGVCAVEGVRAYGIKEGKKGLALIEGKGQAAGVFTSNKIKAAPVILTKKHIEKGRISAIIANSGCANCFTGKEGMKNAEKMAELVASSLNLDKTEVAVASTGPIGTQLNMDLIEKQFKEVVRGLRHGEEGSTAAAKAIMTTDTFHKEKAISLSYAEGEGGVDTDEEIKIGGIAKGAGMIFPHLATMLSFIYTDVKLSSQSLKKCLKESVDASFNMIVVDGDMSTNDMVLLVATGEKKMGEGDFKEGLDFVCKELAKMIARDGEGATKFITAIVKGAVSDADAKKAARAIVRSPLVKSSIFGESPNWGRIIAALGSSDISTDIDESKISISFRSERGEAKVVEKGKFVDCLGIAKVVIRGKEIVISVDMGMGDGEATAWGCDLSYDYVKINASLT